MLSPAAIFFILFVSGFCSAFVPPSVSMALLDPMAKYPGECPCKNKTLCDIIKQPRFDKELFVFHVAGEFEYFDQWRQYDWSRLTTIAVWEFLDNSAELLCYAKSRGVRIVIPASPKVGVYGGSNETAKVAWTKGVAADVARYFADGANMDTEDAIAPQNKTSRDGLTNMVYRLRNALPTGAALAFDVGWMPNIDGRFYDYQGIADHVDNLVIMAYDMPSYIFGACVATPNSPPPQVLQGVLNYLALVQPSQLVLALPWYGRVYPCTPGTDKSARYCPIAAAPWRDSNCTDAKADAVEFKDLAALGKSSVDGPQRDGILQQGWMNHIDQASANVTQLWYDDLESLGVKYRLVAEKGLKGVGIWTTNMLDYGPAPSFNDSALIPQATRDMWTAVSTVPFE